MEFTVTLGQYVKGNSYLYKLDPRFKILALIIMIVGIFLVPTTAFYGMLILLGLILLIMLTGRINVLYVLKGLQPIIFIGLFTFILQTVYTKTGNLLYTFNLNITLFNILVGITLLLVMFFTSKYIPRFKLFYYLVFIAGIFALFAYNTNVALVSWNNLKYEVYSGGLINGGFYMLRIVMIIAISTILTMTTSTMEMNLGLEWIMYPLKFIKVPVSSISMMLSLTLRFIPTLMQETEKIMKAQASRGVDFNEGNIASKVKHIITLIIPMFVVSFNKAEDLSNAMVVRGYVVGAKRTSIDELKFKARDYIGFVIMLLFLAATITMKVIL